MWDGNRHLIRKIKTAVMAGIRPCAMIFHQQPNADWVPFDFKLLEAYQILQDETCPKCGHPIWLCRSEGNNVAFRVRWAICYADRALKQTEASKLKGDEKKNAQKSSGDWGRYFYTEPFNPPNADGPMPTRSQYYESQSEKVAAGKL